MIVGVTIILRVTIIVITISINMADHIYIYTIYILYIYTHNDIYIYTHNNKYIYIYIIIYI